MPQLYQRPSTLHGLKHKLHTGCVNSSSICPTNGTVKPLHNTAATPLSNRRKSVGHIPLSPLARTPSPSPLPSSPTRSPSPLAFPLIGHQPGSSNTTQTYSPGSSLPIVQTVAVGGKKGGFVRTKTSEPSSPLLRRALSPDRLHPRSAETKCTLISPLCCSPPIKQPQRIIGSVWRAGTANNSVINNINNNSSSVLHNVNATNALQTQQQAQQQRQQQEQHHRFVENNENVSNVVPNSVITSDDSLVTGVSNMCLDIVQGTQLVSTPTSSMALSVVPGEMLPRIAEEKDSPTSISESSITAFMNTIVENEIETEIEGSCGNSLDTSSAVIISTNSADISKTTTKDVEKNKSNSKNVPEK